MVETITKLGTWANVFGRRSKLVKEIADDLRALIIGLHPETVEVPRKGEKAVSFGFGEKKMSEAYCYILPQTGYVNLGFYWGAEIDDPNGLLEGTGKKLRHVKIRDANTALSAKVAHLVYLAMEERKSGLGKLDKEKAKAAKSAKTKKAKAKAVVKKQPATKKKNPVQKKTTTKKPSAKKTATKPKTTKKDKA
ncbi:MAG: DUF1801 domain-containing protein [Rhizobiaceae bacterium]